MNFFINEIISIAQFFKFSYLVTTLQHSGGCTTLSPKDTYLQCGTYRSGANYAQPGDVWRITPDHQTHLFIKEDSIDFIFLML